MEGFTVDDNEKVRWRALVAKRMDRSAADAAERTKAQLALSQDALKALLLANGGALVALFTFAGNAIAKNSELSFDLVRLRAAFACFVAGFALGLVAYVMALLSQHWAYVLCYNEAEILETALRTDEPVNHYSDATKANEQHVRYYFGGIGFILTSMALFATGCGFALAAARI